MASGRKKPQWSDVRILLHMRLKDAAAELNVPITYLRRLCRQNGLAQWPGKKIRFMNASGKKVNIPGLDWQGDSRWEEGHQPANTEETEEGSGDGIPQPPVVANHPPGELTTFNLIDKVGLSSRKESS